VTIYEPESLTWSEPDEFHLACLLLSPSATVYLDNALTTLGPEDFYDHTIGQIWGFAKNIHSAGQRITKRALIAAAENKDQSSPLPSIPASAVQAWLTKVAGYPVYPQRIQSSIDAVRGTAKMRRLIQAADAIKHRAVVADDYSQALGWAWDLIRGLEEAEVPAEAVPFATLVDEFHKTITGGQSVGEVVPTPWPELNEVLSGGLHPGRAFIFAGRPGSGKSNSGLNLAATAAEQGFPTLVISEEMSNFEVTGRILAARGGVEYGEITRFAMSPETERGVTEYGDIHRGMPLWVIDQPNLTIEYVAAVARTMKRTQGLDLLVIDYLQLLDASDKRTNREQQVSHISRAIKLLSRELGIAVVTAAQLNRGNVREARRPALSDLRESGSLEQDMDAVILLHHDETDDGRPTGMVTFIVAKNRFGRKGDIELRWYGHQARIGD
jgi:replicative DNA helicase